jgi:hypothetical protein
MIGKVIEELFSVTISQWMRIVFCEKRNIVTIGNIIAVKDHKRIVKDFEGK